MRNYFRVEEFVSEAMYKERGAKAITKMDNRITHFINMLRHTLQRRITCNTWLWGGEFQWRGYRTPESEVYSEYSQHSDGRALDFDVEGMTAKEVRDWIIENRDLDWVAPITFLEDAVSWVHIDCRATPNNDLWLYNIHTGVNITYSKTHP